MKKLQLFLLASLFMTPSINLLASDDSGGKKGIRAGWQMSNFYDGGNSYGDNLSSFYVGIFGEKKLVPLLRLGTGLEYNSVGNSYDVLNTKNTFVRHSIAIPTYLKLKLGPVFVLGGVAPNFGISNVLKTDDKKVDLTDDEKLNVFDAPVLLGLGFKITIISIEARYHWGTMNLSKIDNTNATQQYFQIGAAVSF